MDNLFLVDTYHLGDRTLRNIAETNWEVLHHATVTMHLAEKRPIFRNRHLKNLCDLLLSAKIRWPTSQERDHPKVLTRSCQYCPKIDHSRSISTYATKKRYVCKTNVTCKRTNLVYCISCILRGFSKSKFTSPKITISTMPSAISTVLLSRTSKALVSLPSGGL